MSEKTVRFLFGVVAVLAIVVLFYVAGLYEQYLISDKQFIIRFIALALSFVYSAGQAGAFGDNTPKADKNKKRP